MPNFQLACQFLKDGFSRRVVPAAHLLKERAVVRPLQFAGPYLKKGLVVRPLLFSFIFIGIVLIFLGVREYRQSSAASASSSSLPRTAPSSPATVVQAGPLEITCRDLAAKGAMDSLYVRLTEFELTDHYLPRKSAGGSQWQSAYVPAVPLRIKDSPAVRPLKVLVKSNAVRNQRDLYGLGKAPIEGKIARGIGSLAADEQALLRKSYPHIDLNACWVIEAGSMPAASASVGASGSASAVADARTAPGTGASGAGAHGASSGSVIGKIGGGTVLAAFAAGMLLLAGRRA